VVTPASRKWRQPTRFKIGRYPDFVEALGGRGIAIETHPAMSQSAEQVDGIAIEYVETACFYGNAEIDRDGWWRPKTSIGQATPRRTKRVSSQ
jgi:hypothetical protein